MCTICSIGYSALNIFSCKFRLLPFLYWFVDNGLAHQTHMKRCPDQFASHLHNKKQTSHSHLMNIQHKLTGTLSFSMEKLQTIHVCPTMFSGRGALVSWQKWEQNRDSRWVDGHTLLCSWWKIMLSSASVSTTSTDSSVPSHSRRVSLSKKKSITSRAEIPYSTQEEVQINIHTHTTITQLRGNLCRSDYYIEKDLGTKT